MGERNSTFKRRAHCNDYCARTNPLRRKRQSETFRIDREKEGKICAFCTGKFYRHKGESRSVFLIRKTCSRKCCDANRKKENHEKIAKETKICQGCNGTFTRNVNRKHIESPSAFKKRKTCGNSCSVLEKKKTHPWEKKNSGVIKTSLPPVSPCSVDIPDPPKPRMVEVWRPASLGGPFMREVS